MSDRRYKQGLWLARLIAIGPPLGLLVWIGFYLASLKSDLLKSLPQIIAAAVGASLNREVRIGGFWANPSFSQLTFTDVSVSDAPTFRAGSGRVAMSADRIDVSLDPDGILRDPGNAAAYIDKVVLSRPYLYVERLPGNKFNFSNLFNKPPNPKAKPFAGRVEARDGAVDFRDRLAPAGLENLNRLSSIDGSVDFRQFRTVLFQVAANGPPSRLSEVRSYGALVSALDKKSGSSRLTGYSIYIAASHADAPYFCRYFLAKAIQPFGDVRAGAADVNLTLSQSSFGKGATPDAVGTATVVGGVLAVRNAALVRQPIENLNGSLQFTSSSLGLDATGSVAGMPVHAVGSVPSFRHPYIAFRVDATNVDFARLHEALTAVPALPTWLSVTSRSSVSARVIGPALAPQIDAAFATPSATAYGTPIHGIRGAVRLAGKILTVSSFAASTDGRTDNIQLRGTVSTSAGGVTLLAAHAYGVDLSGITLPAALRQKLGSLRGMVDADATFYTGGPPKRNKRLPVAVTARLTDGELHGVPIREAAVDFATDGRNASIDRFVVVQPNGALMSVTGSAPIAPQSGAPYALKVDAAGIDIGSLASSFGVPGVSGLGYFRGGVAGAGSNPVLSGRASIFSAGYKRYQADHLSATVRLSPKRIEVANGVVRRLGLTAEFAGILDGLGGKAPQVDASVSMKRAEIAGLADAADAMMGAPSSASHAQFRQLALTATGTLDLNARVSGLLAHPAVLANADVTEAQVSGVEISHLSATASYSGETAQIEKLAATVDGAAISGIGLLDLKTQVLRATAKADSVDLGQIAEATDVAGPLGGTVSATVDASGTVAKPRLHLTASIVNGKYREVPFTVKKVVLDYDGNMLTNAGAPVVIQSGPATYTLEKLSYDSRSRTIEALSQVDGERIARLIGIAQTVGDQSTAVALARIPAATDGGLTVTTLDVHGPTSSPVVHVVASVSNLRFDQLAGTDPLQVDADATFSSRQISIQSLKATGPQEYVSGSGTYDMDGRVDAKLEASNIPLSMFDPFVASGVALKGTINDVTVIARGTSTSPRLVGSLSMSDVGTGKFSIDRIDSGRITADNNAITIAGVTLIKNEPAPGGEDIQHIATLRGTIPLAFSLKNGLTASFPSDKPLNLTANLPEQSDSLFSLFAPQLKSFKLGGTIEASLSIGGTLRDKQITGSVSLKDGALQPPGFNTAFHNINLSANFDGSRGTITSSQFQSTAGGYLTLGGSMDFASASQAPQNFSNALEAFLGNVQLDLNLHAADFTVNEPKIVALYNAGFQGSLNGDVTITRGVLAPRIAGNLQIAKAVGILPSVPENSAPTETAPAFNPSFQIALAIAPGARLRSSQIDTQADGAFKIAGDLYRPDITGEVNIRSGVFRFPTAIFRIVPTGTVHLVYNPPEETTERVYITAKTNLTISPALLASNPGGLSGGGPYSYQPATVSPALGTTPQRYTILVTISGNLNAPGGPTTTFTSTPAGLSQTQILAALGGQQALNSLLVGGNVQLALQTEVQQIFTSYAIPTLLEPIESNIASAFGLEEFSLDYAPNLPLQISVLKQLAPRLDVRYTRFVNSRSGGAVASTLQPLEYTIALDYNFTNRFRVYASTDDQHDFSVGLDGVHNF